MTTCNFNQVSQSLTDPSDNLPNHPIPVAAGVHYSIAVVLHQVQFVLEAQLLGQFSEQINAVALQLRASAHGIRVILRKHNKQPNLWDEAASHEEKEGTDQIAKIFLTLVQKKV